jgi:dihydroxyacetone kinase-like predicted kinase
MEATPESNLNEVLAQVASAAIDGARGNSGAIMAQYFQGCLDTIGTAESLGVEGLVAACMGGAEQAWTAMSEPVAGTLPTVLEDFATGLKNASADSGHLCEVFRQATQAARASLEKTPELLPVLKQAGVVDAGGQGFVDLLDGIEAWVERGYLDPLDADWVSAEENLPDTSEMDIGDHQFCTECVIEGQGLDRMTVMDRMKSLDQSSLVVAGSPDRIRVHIHVNNPAEVFLACEEFGELTQQKADDMQWQHGLMNPWVYRWCRCA